MPIATPSAEWSAPVFATPDFRTCDFSVGLDQPDKQAYEQEIVLLSPLAKLLKHYDLLALPRVDITQIYFKKRVVPELAALVLESSDHGSRYSPEEFTRARLREILIPDGKIHRLEIKGPKTLLPSGVFSRIEIGVNIDPGEYAEFLRLPSKGFTMKTRYAIPFEIDSNSTVVRAVANPDLIRATGQVKDGALQPHGGTITLPPFVLTDIEFAGDDQARAFRAGRHTLALAHEGVIEVASLPERTQKLLSASRIAKRGFDLDVQSLVRKLQAA